MRNRDGRMLMDGAASNLDTTATIDSLVMVKKIPIDVINESISKIQKKEEAYGKLNELLANFKQLSDSLRNSPTYLSSSSSVFDSTVISTNCNTSTPASYYLSATTASGAVASQYAISDITIAVAQSKSVQGFTSNSASIVTATPTDGMFEPGTFQIGSTSITLAEGDNLPTIQAKINFLSATTGVKASIIQLASDNFQLTLSSTNPGVANEFTITDHSNIFSNCTNVSWTSVGASDAILTINNQAITRSTNTIADLVPGVTFTLLNSTPSTPGDNTSINVAVNPDTNKIAETIGLYADGFNEIISFIDKQKERDPKTNQLIEDAVLGEDSVLNIIRNSLMNDVYSTVAGANPNFNDISDIGIKVAGYAKGQDNNKIGIMNLLEVNTTDLLSNISTNLANVRQIFETTFVSDNNNFAIYGRSNNITATSFSVDFDKTRVADTGQTYVDKSGVSHTVNNAATVRYTDASGRPGSTYLYYDYNATANTTRFWGLEGSALEGIELLYFGTGTDLANINLTLGVAEKSYQSTEDVINPKDGVLKGAFKYLSDQTKEQEATMKLREKDMEDYRRLLVKQFAKVEEAVSKVNTLIQFLDAQDSVKNNSKN